jgi:solute carrier family 25 protein 33/36
MGYVHSLPLLQCDADHIVVKTRLQLSARKTTKPAIASSSALPGPIASSAAALSSSTRAVKPQPINPLNAVGTAVSIIKQEGIRGLYRGMSASYLGVSEGVIQWVLYEVSPLTKLFSGPADK